MRICAVLSFFASRNLPRVWHDEGIMALNITQIENSADVITQAIALGIDFIALSIIAVAVAQSVIQYVHGFLRLSEKAHFSKIRVTLGRALVLALEFLIGADILRTAVSPTWTRIGQLGAIILLRTLLDFFLEREISDITITENKAQQDDGGK